MTVLILLTNFHKIVKSKGEIASLHCTADYAYGTNGFPGIDCYLDLIPLI